MEQENNENNDAVSKENIFLKIMFENFNEDERQRYEDWHQAKFSDARIKKIVNNILGSVSINDVTLKILASVCKVYVGELVEEARLVMDENNERGAIMPHHLREAFRRLDNAGKNLQSNPLKNLLN